MKIANNILVSCQYVSNLRLKVLVLLDIKIQFGFGILSNSIDNFIDIIVYRIMLTYSYLLILKTSTNLLT